MPIQQSTPRSASHQLSSEADHLYSYATGILSWMAGKAVSHGCYVPSCRLEKRELEAAENFCGC